MESRSRLTGERPQQGVTPDSLLSLHDAGYRAIIDRLGSGKVLDIGCGQGFETDRLCDSSRSVFGVDYAHGATSEAKKHENLQVARMNALSLGFASQSFDSVCSSHLIEHFTEPEEHVSEIARVLAPDGSAYFLTPNEPADFENPFHVYLFDPPALMSMLGQYFNEVWLGGVDATEEVKKDFADRRAKGKKLLRLDFLSLRHKMPRSWYIAAYTHLLPLAYRILGSKGTEVGPKITEDDWHVTEDIDDSTLVLFAICKRPRKVNNP